MAILQNFMLSRWHKGRYFIVLLFLVGGFINYIDRAALSIAAPEFIRELRFSAFDIGILGAVFSYTYAWMQLPSGWLIDRFGVRFIFVAGLLIWSFAEFAHGLASALWVFVLLRMILGVGEAPGWASAAKATVAWFPTHERGVASSIWDTASKWGPAIGPVLLTVLMVTWDWNTMFEVTGAVGFAFAIVFAFSYTSPSKSKRLSRRELDYIKAGGGAVEVIDGPKASVKEWFKLFKFRTTWGMMGGYCCQSWISIILLVFLPLYLVQTFHVSLKEMGLLAGIPWVGGAVGELIGGYATRFLMLKYHISGFSSRRRVIAASSIGAAGALIAVPFGGSLTAAIVLLTIALAFIATITGNAWALAGDVVAPSKVASLATLQNFGGFIGGTFSPLVAGALVSVTGTYVSTFISGGVIAGLGAFCYLLIVRRPIDGTPAEAALGV